MKLQNSILCLVLIAGISFAQNKVAIQTFNETSNAGKPYLMDAGPLLEKFYKANRINLEELAKHDQTILKKTNSIVSWNVGDKKSWWAEDLVSNQFYSVPSTCYAVGVHCYVFVEDSSWTKGRVDQHAVDQIVNAFDNTTPANTNKGVYQMDVETFGNPPNINNDPNPKIVILLLNIRDGYVPGTSSGYTAGYFTGYNETNATNSNKTEFYYMDCYPMNLTNPSSLATGLQITAHEFQHMIQWNYHSINPNSTFFNEGCSMIAEVVCGYPLRLQSYYSAANQTNVPMMSWSGNPPGNVLSDYARAARFFLYIKEQFGVSALAKFVQSALTDVNAFDIDVFPKLSPSTSRRFKDVMVDWYIANYMNNTSVNSKWGYTYAGLPVMAARSVGNPNVSNYNDSVYKLGVQYFTYSVGSNLTMNINLKGNTGLVVKAIKSGAGGTQMVDGTMLGNMMNFSMPDFGGPNVSSVTFMVCQNDFYFFDPNKPPTQQDGPYNYSYTSTGTVSNKVQEIAYDTGLEPIGVLGLTPGDSVAVIFDGVGGAKLDSIRVALRNNLAPVHGGVYAYVGSGTRLGGKALAAPLTLVGITTPPVPYPPHWTNWVKVDLRSYNISASNSFVAMFVVEGTYPGSNRVMVTDYLSSSMYHSMFCDSTGSWVYYSDKGNPGYIFLNMIRAYVSFGPSDVKQIVELKPVSFKVEQNYPNPFNPGTVISYQLPTLGNVEIKIYDVLGQEIATLVNEEKPAGKYQTVWNGTDNFGSKVTSGVYFYMVKAGNNIETKKMILMK